MKKKIIFAGYAPVHFVCFQPVYRRLAKNRNLGIYLSGRFKDGSDDSVWDLYRPFRVPKDRIITLGEMQRRSFDMVLCAHVSGYFPKSDRERVQLFHGLSFRNVATRRDVLVFDHLFITGPYMMRKFQEKKLLRPGDPRCIPVGFPKVDRLVDGSLDRMKILKRLGMSGKRPVILFAPTGQKYNSLETGLGEEVLRRLRLLDRYDIIVKLHDHPRDKSVDWAKRLRVLQDSHLRLATGFDIVPYLFAADLLMTDASSVSSEYSILNRPMVFLDVPELLELARKKGHAVDLETWGRRGGITARWPDEAVDAVQWSLEHPEHKSDVRRAMAGDLFYNPGNAANVAANWILERLDLRHKNRSVGRGEARTAGKYSLAEG
jgi:hypothetical protein